MNSMALASPHMRGEPTSGPRSMQLKPLLPARTVVMLPSFPMRTTAAPLATAAGAAERAAAMYAESVSAALPGGALAAASTARSPNARISLSERIFTSERTELVLCPQVRAVREQVGSSFQAREAAKLLGVR